MPGGARRQSGREKAGQRGDAILPYLWTPVSFKRMLGRAHECDVSTFLVLECTRGGVSGDGTRDQEEPHTPRALESRHRHVVMLQHSHRKHPSDSEVRTQDPREIVKAGVTPHNW